VALAPDPNGPDRDGCFSGVAVKTGDGVTLIYTGVRGDDQLPCLATSTDDDLATWEKYDGNPVIAAPPEGIETTMFRDHSVWREGDTWYQAIGSGIADVGGAVLLYRSPDLFDWEYLGPLLVENPEEIAPEWQTTGWECPDFFALGDRHVLVFSLWGGDLSAVGYYAGTYNEHRFVPDRHGLVDGGRSFYAPQSFTDDAGRRIMLGWLRETCADEVLLAHGWAGAMSLPREVTVAGDGSLRQGPAAEVEGLRGRGVHLDWQPVDWFRAIDLQGIPGNCLEIDAEFEWADQALIAFNFCGVADEAERSVISISTEDRDFRLDTSGSSTSPAALGNDDRMKIDLEPGAPITLRIFVDMSIIEVFLNDRYCLTSRVYPAKNDDFGLHISSTVAGKIDIWEMVGE
jgi:beta-fructofuranosidase